MQLEEKKDKLLPYHLDMLEGHIDDCIGTVFMKFAGEENKYRVIIHLIAIYTNETQGEQDGYIDDISRLDSSLTKATHQEMTKPSLIRLSQLCGQGYNDYVTQHIINKDGIPQYNESIYKEIQDITKQIMKKIVLQKYKEIPEYKRDIYEGNMKKNWVDPSLPRSDNGVGIG